jgi:DNA-binding response OmpR family regulator
MFEKGTRGRCTVDTIRILMIDDEVDLCRLVKSNMESMGNFNVDFTLNGKEGIELAKKIRPDLIILDIFIPRMDGFAVLKTLKEDIKTMGIPVVMLTALGDEANKIKASGLYDEDYIVKPIEAQTLITKIEEVLRRMGKLK